MQGISIYDLVLRIADEFCLSINDICDIGPERLGKDNSYLLDSSFLSETLSWKEDFSLDKSVKGVRVWIEKNFSILRKFPLEYVHRP